MYIYISMTIPKIIISATYPVLPGSISVVYSTCGRKHCACHVDSKKLHGPFYRWTGFIKGKRTTKTINQKIAKECKKRINNYKKLCKVWDRVTQKAIANAPWL